MPLSPTLIQTLCSRDATLLRSRIDVAGLRAALQNVAIIALGCGLYGFTIGLWRHPLQGCYVAIKMPLMVLLTLGVNGLLNGILAQLLDSGLSMRQTLAAQLHSYALFSVIVASLSPLAFFMVLEGPKPGTHDARGFYESLMVTHTAVIAYAGIVANIRLFHLLRAYAGKAATAGKVLLAWLGGNLFVGAQISYTLRPFFGQPRLEVQFLRPNPFEGNFWESLWWAARGTLSPPMAVAAGLGVILAVMLCLKKLSRDA